jgi:hypothetical protein
VSSIVFPHYLPHNAIAERLTHQTADALGLSLSGKTGHKHEIIVASFLHAVKHRDENTIVWRTGKDNQDSDYWAFIPKVGQSISLKICTALEDVGLISRITIETIIDAAFPNGLDETHRAAFMSSHQTNGGKQTPPTFFGVNTDLLDIDALAGASFVEANRPHVYLNKAEQPKERIDRKRRRDSAPKHTLKTIKATYGPAYSRAVSTVKQMNAMWLQHPLHLPTTPSSTEMYFASATRIYHNGNFDSGGRWYGGWTSLSRETRKQLTIDGEPVVEVDLNASLLTLLSCVVSQPMQCGNTWEYAYAVVAERLEFDEPYEVSRAKVKQVIVELIGTGNPHKAEPAAHDKDSPFDDSETSKEEFNYIRDLCHQAYPALLMLNQKDMNFVAALSFHEATIITQTMLRLKDIGVAAYSMHDGLIVKQSNADITVSTLREVYDEYVTAHQVKHRLTKLGISVPLSVEGINVAKHRHAGDYVT